MKAFVVLLVGFAGLTSCATSYADEASESKMRDMLKQATLQLRTAQDENALLKIQQETLKAQLSQSTKPQSPSKLTDKPTVNSPEKTDEKLKQKISQQEQTINQLNRQLAQLQQQNTGLKANSEQLGALQQTLKQAQMQKTSLETNYAAQQSSLQSKVAELESQVQALNRQLLDSEQKNKALVEISQTLVVRYKEKGVFSALRDQEPLTGLYRVKLESLAQEYQSKIRDQTSIPQQTTPQHISANE